MAIKGAKSIAEYKIRQYLLQLEVPMEYFSLSMDGNKGMLTDANNDTLILIYDAETKSVYEK